MRAGWSVRRIALESGFSHGLVTRRCTAWGLIPSPLDQATTAAAAAMWRAHVPLDAIAEHLGHTLDRTRLAVLAAGEKVGRRGPKRKLDPLWAATRYVDELATVAEIAAEAKVAPVTVYTALRRQKIRLRDDARIQDPRIAAKLTEEYLYDRLIVRWWTYKAVAADTGADYNTVCRQAARYGLVRRMPLSTEEARRAVRLYKAGATVDEVRAELGRGYQAVTMALAAADVLRSPSRTKKRGTRS